MTAHQTARSAPSLLLHGVALLLLIGAPAFFLDEREFTEQEAWTIQGLLGPMESETRIAPPSDATPATAGLLASWAVIVGTTERPLKLLWVLLFWIAALLVGEAAQNTFGGLARVFVWLAMAASPWHLRPDLIAVDALALGPLAAILLGFPILASGPHRERSGATSWPTAFLLSLLVGLGVFLAGALGGTSAALLGTAALVGLAAWERRLPLAAAAALLGVAGLGWLRGPAALWPALSFSEAAFVVGLPLALLACAAAGTLKARRTPLAVAVAVGIATLVFAGPSALPFLAFGIGGFGRGSRRVQMSAAALLLLVIGFALVNRPKDPGSPLRDVLVQARVMAEPGGRLVVAGNRRAGVLFYSRRGHAPGVPLVLIPEDVVAAQLAAALRERMGVDTGQESSAPVILVHPADLEVPGLLPTEDTRGAVARRRLAPR